jgi:cytoskeletal protein CcmA (bactofilin family)
MQQSSESPDHSELDSLEGPSAVVEVPHGAGETVAATPGTPDPDSQGTKSPKFSGLHKLIGRFNIYLILFVFTIAVAITVIAITVLHSKTTSNTIGSSTLSQSTLSQLASSDATVGDPKQVLTVQSNAVFDGQLLVRSNLAVAGTLQVGGSLSLTGLLVSGSSIFNQVQVNSSLSVAGNSALQGTLTVQKSLNVNGSGAFSGALSASSITANTMQLNGDLTITHHVTFGGSIPSRSSGSALGSGGTVSISGSDSSGSISINTGSGTVAGCFVSVTFVQSFNTTPHVIISPIGSSAAGLAYYVNRSSTSFSVCTATAAPGSANFGFDYLVLE